ncbi:hypothetical protein L1O03_02980 [Corynebacterium uropygiale]|uniref:Uncharacterized protein n=1 Tax=Corynebacterium uropygiale TaxID=1775911 RepID=A0A9X1U6X0_9CORY|nr:hypothetical protein [Corynebacterium uropygiale]MCF4006142.1 hypothetical protein [Corynebacterium uropygiale]
MITPSDIRMVQKTLGQPYDDDTVKELYLDACDDFTDYFSELHLGLMEKWWKEHPEVRHGMQTPECTMATSGRAAQIAEEWVREEYINGPLREYYAKHPEPFGGEEDDRWVPEEDEDDLNDPDNWAREEQQYLF